MRKKQSPRGTALVTGAARRIGKVIAEGLANRGWAVAIHCNKSEKNAKAIVNKIKEAGGRAALVRADLMIEEEVSNLVEAATSTLGPITCLINNASAFEYDNAATVSQASWDLHMAVNLRAPFILAQKMAQLLPAKKSGNIINIIDQRVWNPSPNFISYTLSKMALWNLTQTLAMAFAPQIRVNGIGPGPVLKSKRQSDMDFKLQWAQLPLARRVTPDEISAGICFILDAKAMTGQMIALDSGEHLGWSSNDRTNLTE